MLYRMAVVMIVGGLVMTAANSAMARPHGGDSREDMRKKFMEKFDKDGDGKLDEKERAAIRKAWSDRRGSSAHRGRRGSQRGGHHGSLRRGHGGKASSKGCATKGCATKGCATKGCATKGCATKGCATKGCATKACGKTGVSKCGGKDGCKKTGAGSHGRRGHHQLSSKWADMKKEFMAKYDKNKDGKLSDDERKSVKADWKKRGEEMKKEFMAKYDKNKDGKLDDKEKKAVREAWAAKHKEWREKMRARHSGSRGSDKKKDAPKKNRAKKDSPKTDKAPSDDRRAALFKRIMAADKNGDGKLNADEMPVPVRGGFSSADLNKDGYIDKEELKKRIFK